MKFFMTLLMVVMVTILSLCGNANADIGVTYDQKAVWHGFELFGETDAWSPQVTGKAGPLSVRARGLLAGDSGYQDFERWDAQVSISQQISFLQVTGGYGFYYYPENDIDFWESWITAGIPIGPVTPRYTLLRAESLGLAESDWLHIAGIDWQVTDKAKAFAELTYNEGFSPYGLSLDPDWTHALFGLTYDIPIGPKLVLTPAIYHQVTFEDTVNNKENQTWLALTLTYPF